jgi:CRISPR-associated protein Csx3
MINLLPAVLVGGPPHAGKSVLFYHLTQALRARHLPHHAIRACADGEGNWFHEGQPETVSSIRVKLTSEWPASFVQRMCHDLQYRCLPFLVDMGGHPRASQMSLFRHCTHSILLLREDKPDDTQRWQQIVADNDLLPLAHIYSQQRGAPTVTELSPMLQGTIVGLDRHMPMPAYNPLFDELVDRIAALFSSYDLEELKKTHLAHAPTELTLDLGAALRAFTTTSTEWVPAMLPAYLESLPAEEPLSVYGVGPNWLYAALAAHAGEQPFYLFDPKLPLGWVQPVPVCIGEERSDEICVKSENYEEYTVLKIAFLSDRLEYFQPNPLAFPSVAVGKGVIIDGRLPNWLLVALTRLYREVGVPWIAPFYVRANQAVVAYSCVEKYCPGDLVPRPMPTTYNHKSTTCSVAYVKGEKGKTSNHR